MNYFLIFLYTVFAVSGSTFLKLGGNNFNHFITMPFINIKISFVMILGFILYGISFILYTILLNKFELSFISPITISVVYLSLMVVSVLIFKEAFTIQKTIGSILILAGVLFIVSSK